MIDTNNRLKELRRKAASDMSNETDLNFDQCYDLLSAFLNDIQPNNFYNIYIDLDTLNAKSVKLKNIISNTNGMDCLDVVEGLATITASVMIYGTKEFWTSSILAMVFLVRAAKKLATITLKKKHALLLLALNNFKEINFDAPQTAISYINSEYHESAGEDLPFTQDSFQLAVMDLKLLDVIRLNGSVIVLNEKVILS